MDITPKQLMRRLEKAKQRRVHWESHWRFSCWNENDPNRDKIEAVDDTNRIFAVCKRIAMRAVSGVLEDRTQGSTHYHTKTVNPPWAWNKAPTVEIGRHLFYANVE